MSGRTLLRAQAGDEQAFRELTDPYRRELQVHCYRIVGSLQDAEDLLQETLLAAWRGLDRFEERASLRSWLYRIATNRCLNMLRDSQRRPKEAPPVPEARTFPEPTRWIEPAWLEPYPDVLLEELPDAAPGPEARYETKEALSLAFITGLQRLPPAQRAALVLRDVMGFRAAEVAEMLESSEPAVNSALQRARAALDTDRAAVEQERAPLPRSPLERELVGHFTEAFESGDVEQLVAVLSEDARLTMPPEPLEYEGHAAIAEFLLDRRWFASGSIRLVATRANGQPAFGYYIEDPATQIARANGMLVLTLAGDRICGITRFGDSSLLARFGLPRRVTLG